MKNDRSKFKGTKKLVLYRDYIHMEFSEIRNYILETEALIRAKKKELESYVDEQIKQYPESEHEIVDHFLEDLIKYDRTYIELLMNSTFTSTYSLFEGSFIRVCKYAKAEGGLERDLNLTGQGIVDKCKRFLKDSIEVEFDSLESDWQLIKNHNKMRNLVVHNSSNLNRGDSKPVEQQSMYGFVSSNSYIDLKPSGAFHIIDYRFVIDFCDTAELFLQKIIDKILRLN